MMKFCLGLLALFSALSYSAGAVQIFDDFLSSEECDGFLRQANDRLSVSPNAGVENPRFRFKIPIDRGINERLVVALNNHISVVSCENDNHDDQTCKAPGDTPQVQEPEVYISSILRSTNVHKDSIVDKNDKPLDPDGFKVGFVFLDNNDEGYFLHGRDKIEAKKGSFVTFEGRVEHRTVVPSGAKTPIHLLGPFTMTTDKTLSLVGVVDLKDDSASTSDGRAININVIANDIAGGPLTSAAYNTNAVGISTPTIVSGNGVTNAGTATDVLDVNSDKTGVIRYQPASGFLGTVRFTYTVYTSNTATVTVTVVKDTFVNPLAISNQGASDQVQNGLKGAAVGLTFGAPSQLGINGILNPVTDIDTSDMFLSNTAPAAVQFNFAQSFSDFFCIFRNCNN
jgi:hypothetical protein